MGISHEQTQHGADIGPTLPSFEAMARDTNTHSTGAISLGYRTESAALFPAPPRSKKTPDFSEDVEMTCSSK